MITTLFETLQKWTQNKWVFGTYPGFYNLLWWRPCISHSYLKKKLQIIMDIRMSRQVNEIHCTNGKLFGVWAIVFVIAVVDGSRYDRGGGVTLELLMGAGVDLNRFDRAQGAHASLRWLLTSARHQQVGRHQWVPPDRSFCSHCWGRSSSLCWLLLALLISLVFSLSSGGKGRLLRLNSPSSSGSVALVWWDLRLLFALLGPALDVVVL